MWVKADIILKEDQSMDDILPTPTEPFKRLAKWAREHHSTLTVNCYAMGAVHRCQVILPNCLVQSSLFKTDYFDICGFQAYIGNHIEYYPYMEDIEDDKKGGA